MTQTQVPLKDTIQSEQNSRPKWLPITSIIILAACLYFYQLGTESLWIDELYSIEDAQKGIPELLSTSTRPAYYILLHVWMLFGTDEAWLRGLSVIFALVTIFLVYKLGSHLIDDSVGLLAAGLMTLSPIFINHAQEVRMYGLSNCLCLGGTLALSITLERIRAASLISWLVLRILAVLTTPLNIFLLIPDGILWLWKLRKHRQVMIIFALAGLGLVGLSLFWIYLQWESIFSYFQDWSSGQPKPGIANVIARLTSFTARWPLRTVSSPLSHFYKLYTVMLVGILGFSFTFVNPKYNPKVFRLAAWAFLPAGALLTISWLLSPIWLPRYLLFVAPYLLILLAAGFLGIWRKQRKLAIVITLMYIFAMGAGLENYYSSSVAYRANWRGVTQMIAQEEQPGDVLAAIISHSRPSLALKHYYQNHQGSLAINVVDNCEGKNSEKESCQGVENTLESLPAFDSRLWLVYLDTTASAEELENFQQKVKEAFQVDKQQTFNSDLGVKNDIEVFLLSPK